jgi:MoaA/NifB/PqqE/SkfB family radical SAM enzyme
MTLDEYRFVLEQFKGCNIIDFKLHGLSEAMLIKDFDKYVALVREYFPKASIIVITNHQYDLRKSALLKVLPMVDAVWLSMDGHGETFEYIRTGAKWDKTVKFLDDLAAAVPEETRRKKFFIQFTLSSENYKDLPKVYAVKEKYKLNSVRFNLVQDWRGEHLNSRLEYPQEIIDFIQPYKGDLQGVGGWQYKDCFWPYEGMFIDAYGEIRHCIMNYTMKPIGNIFKDNVRELYNHGEVYVNARKGLSKNCPPEQCASCDYHHLSDTLTRIHGKEFLRTPKSFKFKALLTPAGE